LFMIIGDSVVSAAVDWFGVSPLRCRRLVAEAMASPALICDTEQWKALQVREPVADRIAASPMLWLAHCFFFFFCFHSCGCRRTSARFRRRTCGTWWPTPTDARQWRRRDSLLCSWNFVSCVCTDSVCVPETWKVSGCSEYEGIFLDYSRQQATGETIDKLLKLAEVTPLSPFHFGGGDCTFLW